jgi:hypothetical protein
MTVFDLMRCRGNKNIKNNYIRWCTGFKGKRREEKIREVKKCDFLVLQ